MKKLMIIFACLFLAIGLHAQTLTDFLGADQKKFTEFVKNEADYTQVEIKEDLLLAVFEGDLPVAFRFKDGVLIEQHLFYPRSMANTLIKFLAQYVEMERLKHYANFNVDPPTFYKLTWEEEGLVLTLHE